LLARVFSVARKGITSLDAFAAVVFGVVFRTVFGCATPVTKAMSDIAQTSERIRDADMETPPACEHCGGCRPAGPVPATSSRG
jgi:hypothetical protein